MTYQPKTRPYQISIDWLSVSCDTTLFFKPEEENEKYKLSDAGYGAKFWRKILKIERKTDGRKIGVLCYENTQACNANLAVLKFENELLYDKDCFEVVCDVILSLGLRFRGISRIDMACDFNEFHGGLTAPNLMSGYKKNKYLKGGTSKYMLIGHHNYFAHGKDESTIYDQAPIFDEKLREKEAARIEAANQELIAHGLPPISRTPPKRILAQDIQEHTIDSLTWGSRSNGVQVQLYNKTREMQEVAPKWYIVETWKNAGLDLSKDVWRLEIRITTRGKELRNSETGQEFRLSVIDVITQEQLEALFFSYCEKYFKWYRNDGHEKLQNCKRLKLFNIDFEPIVKPFQFSRTAKTFNRTAKLVAKELKIHQMECETAGNTKLAGLLKEVQTYYQDMYRLGRYMQDQDIASKLESGEINTYAPKYIPIEKRFETKDGDYSYGTMVLSEKPNGVTDAQGRPLGREYYSRRGLAAIAIGRRAELEKPWFQSEPEEHIPVDWDSMDDATKNVFALFRPMDEVTLSIINNTDYYL